MSGDTLRIGIVGAGANTRARHLPNFRKLPGVQIVSVCNRTRESGERAAREWNIPKVYANWLDLVSESDTDAICIGTWPHLHCPVTLAALDSHKHVLCEARMAMHAQEAHTMLGAARNRPDLVAQVVPAPFTLAADDTILRLISDGVLGDVVGVDLQAYQGAFVDRAAPITWRQDAALSGVNMLSVGIWYETLLRWLGPARRLWASASVTVPVRKNAEGLDCVVEVPDHVSVIGEWARGGQFNLRFSAVTGMAPRNGVWIYGTEATLWVETDPLRLRLARRGDAEYRDVPLPDAGDGWRVEEEFLAAVRGLAPVRRTTFEDGARYMEFTEAVLQSAKAGQAVTL